MKKTKKQKILQLGKKVTEFKRISSKIKKELKSKSVCHKIYIHIYKHKKEEK